MGFDFSAGEIFALAIQIEKNGAAFYRKAAESLECADTKKLLEDLAGMEDGHEAFFEKLMAALPEEQRHSGTFDPDGESGMYLKSLADRRVFTPEKDPLAGLSGSCSDESLRDVLNFAVSREKDSIVFYLGLKDYVGTDADKCKVDEIIAEEMSHVRILNKELMALKKKG